MMFSTVLGPQEPALTVLDRGVVCHERHRPPAHRRHTRNHAVGPEALLLPVGQQRVLHEGALVHQAGHALAHRQLALL